MLKDILSRIPDVKVSTNDIWAQLTELDRYAALFSEEYGGLGGNGFDLAVTFETVAVLQILCWTTSPLD